MTKETFKCINSSLGDTNASTKVRNMITRKKLSKHFDLKYADAMESTPEMRALKSKLRDAQCNRMNFQQQKS